MSGDARDISVPCPFCGYDCRATPGRSSECGRLFAVHVLTPIRPRRKPPLWAQFGDATLALAIIGLILAGVVVCIGGLAAFILELAR